MSDSQEIKIKLTPEQQQQICCVTGGRPPAIKMTSLEFGVFRLAAMAVGSNVLPVSKSPATIKQMLVEGRQNVDKAGPLTITLQLTTDQKEQIKQITDQVPTSVVIAPDEWDVVFQEEWAAHMDLLRLGRSLVIVPDGSVYKADRLEHVIVLPPAKEAPRNVFGTGMHATTQLALILLEESIKKGDRVLDLGTGSGVLAVAAARLGASEVLALDIELEAVSTAQETVGVNNLNEIVRVEQGGLEASGPFYDVVVANIFANVLIRLAHDLYSAVRPSGILITSGIIKARANDVAATCSLAGFHLESRRSQDGWEALEFSKP